LGRGVGDLLTLDEAAAKVRLHRTTLARAIERGELEAARLCGRWRIRTESIERWITSSTPAPRQPAQRPHLTAVPHVAPPRSAQAARFAPVRRKAG
jgi:excisionase family DNA binding protein